MKRMTQLALILSGLGAANLGAQAPTPQEKVAALKAGIAANEVQLHKYQWLQTTTVALKGEVKSTTVSQCSYQGGAPKPVCTQISENQAEKPHGGPLMKHEIEKKQAEMKAYMDSVKTLIESYVPPNPALMDKAVGSGNVAVAPNPSNGTTKLTVSNYLQQGDAVALVVGDASGKLVSAAINTWLNAPNHTVTLQVTFASLSDGTSYPSPKVLTATEKEIVITTTSSQFAMSVQ
jgi:hypothetical protein